MMARTGRKSLLWLQSGGCGGCTLSLLCAEGPELITALDAIGIDLMWHPSLSEESGQPVLSIMEDVIAGRRHLDIFCLEGAVMTGPGGTGRYHMMGGSGRPMMWWIGELAKAADHVVAIGSCAAFGGITAANGNAVEARGLAFSGREAGGFLGNDFTAGKGAGVVNVAGCPTHPGWVIETLSQIASDNWSDAASDGYGRPRAYADHLVHHGCPRNEYYEFKASAEQPSDLGCMMEHMGCKGTQAHADCNTRPWNGSGSCLKGGYPCINCTAPAFEDPGYAFATTPKFAGIPVGLPTDMPKAWFVALASLSKAATPRRLRENAVSHRQVVPPSERGLTKK
jgi:uptake hydrogenase small subunit